MTQKKRRAKNEPTLGDKLHQAYRNRAAMDRVYEAAVLARMGVPGYAITRRYWTPGPHFVNYDHPDKKY
jgi:hypothetical protein